METRELRLVAKLLAEPADVAVATASLSAASDRRLFFRFSFIPQLFFLTQTSIDPSLQLDISFLSEH